MKLFINRSVRTMFLLVLGMLAGTATGFGSSLTLEGQNQGDTTTWSSGNLQNWKELD
jgi:hypothetical protein